MAMGANDKQLRPEFRTVFVQKMSEIIKVNFAIFFIFCLELKTDQKKIFRTKKSLSFQRSL